jgi:hypothetical protein
MQKIVKKKKKEKKKVAMSGVLEMPFPNSEQRNVQELLSKAKGKVLLHFSFFCVCYWDLNSGPSP